MLTMLFVVTVNLLEKTHKFKKNKAALELSCRQL